MTTTLLILSIAANVLLGVYAFSYRAAFIDIVETLGQAYEQLDRVSAAIHAGGDIDNAFTGYGEEPRETVGDQGSDPLVAPTVYQELQDGQ